MSSIEIGRDRDVETTVSSTGSRVVTTSFDATTVRQEHGHPRAIFAPIEDLFSDVFSRIEAKFTRMNQPALSGVQVKAVYRFRRGEGLEGVKEFGCFLFGRAPMTQCPDPVESRPV